jgi:hypothetical protein
MGAGGENERPVSCQDVPRCSLASVGKTATLAASFPGRPGIKLFPSAGSRGMKSVWGRSHAKDNSFWAKSQRLARRIGKTQAIVAVWHTVAVSFSQMITKRGMRKLSRLSGPPGAPVGGPGPVPLRCLLSTRHLDRKQEATHRFRRDPRRGCHCRERFVLFHHTLLHRWPLGSRKTVCRLLWSWSSLLDHRRRRASLSWFLLSKQVLHLLIQFPRRGKEEGKNW